MLVGSAGGNREPTQHYEDAEAYPPPPSLSSPQSTGSRATQQVGSAAAEATIAQQDSHDPATPKDQTKLKRQAEDGKARKHGGFPGSFLLSRIFYGIRGSSGGGAKPAAAISVQELGSELLRAGKSAAIAEVAAATSSSAVIKAAVEEITASPGSASRAAYGTVAGLVKKMIPSFRDSTVACVPVRAPPPPLAPDSPKATASAAGSAAEPQPELQPGLSTVSDALGVQPVTPVAQRSPAIFVFGQERPKSGRRSASKAVRIGATPPRSAAAVPSAEVDGRKRKADATELPRAKLLPAFGKADAVEGKDIVEHPSELPAASSSTAAALQPTDAETHSGLPAAPAVFMSGVASISKEMTDNGLSTEPTQPSEPAGVVERPAATPDAPANSSPSPVGKGDPATGSLEQPLQAVAHNQEAQASMAAVAVMEEVAAKALPREAVSQPVKGNAKKGGFLACFGCFGMPAHDE
ncbi:hypothetical protein GPECTOR_18g72 [Gonium pectorale]|uniref:Uncharacterized protein n=1 Tax=Gonium pectorale TaxID=33097 RepID=A0A150GJV3_GONPE|nr:hypothetical protein GPECTOR_18g72 [Gonium pectorale]|eukprot:KXZ50096.1 hypothetical protein GPECTOR_18g72 [Gonium pectorale]